MPSKLRSTVEELFEENAVYTIPYFYQRQYVWTREKQWESLWEDIRTKTLDYAEARPSSGSIGQSQRHQITRHFMGAVVVQPQHKEINDIQRYEVVDGQQRLTTIQVLLHAIRHVALDLGFLDFADELERLTRNKGMKVKAPEETYKIRPTDADWTAFHKVMKANSRQEVAEALNLDLKKLDKRQWDEGIDGAYFFFQKAILEFCTAKENGNGTKPADRRQQIGDLYTIVTGTLDVVMISLLEGEDDPQVIFDALNGRGTPLLPSDLIKNFVFERAKRLADVETARQQYATYWSKFDTEQVPVEDENEKPPKFWKVEEKQGRLKRSRIDLFLFHYLQYRRVNEVRITELFREYRDWWTTLNVETLTMFEVQLGELKRHAEIYHQFVEQRVTGGDKMLSGHLRRLRAIDTSTIFPVMLFLFSEAAKQGGRVRREELPTLLRDIESYLVRRAICGFTPKKYNYVFLKLLKDLLSLPAIEAGTVGKLLATHDVKNDTLHFPTDEQFRLGWMTERAYTGTETRFLGMVLRAISEKMPLPMGQEEAVIDYGKQHVEHLMPRKWNTGQWQLQEPNGRHHEDADGTIVTNAEWRDRALDTIGNLTLLKDKLNISLSNGLWSVKQPKIIESVLAINLIFRETPWKDRWDETSIEARGKEMFRLALELWPRPNTEGLVGDVGRGLGDPVLDPLPTGAAMQGIAPPLVAMPVVHDESVGEVGPGAETLANKLGPDGNGPTPFPPLAQTTPSAIPPLPAAVTVVQQEAENRQQNPGNHAEHIAVKAPTVDISNPRQAKNPPDSSANATITNPYRSTSGYFVLFEVIRTNPPMTREQIEQKATAEMVRRGEGNYKVADAFNVVTAKMHKSKRGDYQMERDDRRLWHLVVGGVAKASA